MQAINIGLLGLGTVGSGVVAILQKNQPKLAALNTRVVAAAVRTITPERQAKYPGIKLTQDPQSIVDDPSIDIVVEVMGGVATTYPLLERAITNGKHVISANKDLLSVHGVQLAQLAKKHHVGLYYEAAVMGSIPVLHTLANAYAGDTITRVAGIANGTSNFILTQMVRAGSSYSEALKLAQVKGFAEADPTNDVEGFDAAYKLLILSRFAFGMTPALSDVTRQGITTLTRADFAAASVWGYTIKPLAVAAMNDHKLSLTVSPHLVPAAHPLSAVFDENNAVMIDSVNTKQITMTGPGAGSLPTASSVISDLITIASAIRAGIEPAPFVDAATPNDIATADDRVSERFVVLHSATLQADQAASDLGIGGKMISGEGSIFIHTPAISDTETEALKAKIEATKDLALVHILPIFA
ncbi:homoserine dehydrogenase [Lacticaseibacillus hulanensis]|uniref:homoserine dehydrogenase n=1 Tax=Lacticaseibacillus hulanensis TaxID=2493111 RepID=UPI000FD9CFF8|nr:homoserine dehydrogenase [Lacticaseibacillus hulanensis]